MLRRWSRIPLVVVLTLSLTAVAAAYWTASGTGTAAATTGTLNAPTAVSGAASGTTVNVHWTAPAGLAPDGYYVVRTRVGDSATSPACASSPTSLISGTSCADATVPDGSYTYSVVAVFASWTATSAASASVQVAGDVVAPSVTVEQKTDQADPTNTQPIAFTVTFSEPVSGFTSSDVVRGGTAGVAGSTATITGGPTVYQVAVAGVTGNGTVRASVGAGAAVDAAGNASLASTSADNTVTLDTIAPTVTINQAAAQADPTNAQPITFTAVFSEPVVGFTSSDVVRSGTAGTASSTVALSAGPTTFTASVSGISADGTVVATIPAGSVADAAGNVSTASSSTDNVVTYDATAPVLQTVQMIDRNTNGKVDEILATFNETLASSTLASAWTLGGSVPSGGSRGALATSGTTATLTIGEGPQAADTAVGSLTVALAAAANGIRDALGNQSSFAARVPVDLAKPVPTALTDTNGLTDGKFEGADTLTLTFSEAVANSATTSIVVLTDASPRDTLAIPGMLAGAVDSGNRDYISSGSATFAGSLLTKPAANQVRVALSATCSTAGCANLGTGALGNVAVTPSTTITDLASTPNTAAANSALPTFSLRLF